MISFFDNEMLAQSIYFGYRIGESLVPPNTSRKLLDQFHSQLKYGFGVLSTTLKMRFQKLGIARYRLFSLEVGN